MPDTVKSSVSSGSMMQWKTAFTRHPRGSLTQSFASSALVILFPLTVLRAWLQQNPT